MLDWFRTTRAEGTPLTVENFNNVMVDLRSQAEEYITLSYRPLLKGVSQKQMATTAQLASTIPGSELNRLLLILSELEKTPYREDTRASCFNLKEEQKWIIQQIQKNNARALLGLSFKVAFTSAGLKTVKDWEGKLVSILGGGEDAPLEFMTFKLSLKDGSVYEAKIFQIIPVKKVKLEKLDKKDLATLKKAQEEKAAYTILDLLNRNTNTEYSNLKNNRDRLKRDLETYVKTVEDYTRKLTDIEKIISGKKIKTLSLKDLNEIIATIKKHALVEDVYISKQASLIVLTKELVGVDPETGKVLKTPVIGRMILKTEILSGISFAYNLDWTDGQHGHPNLTGHSICKGSTEADLMRFAKAGDYYAVIDLLILFFSLYPQDGGSPYIDFDTWLKIRRRTDYKDSGFKESLRQMLLEPLFEPTKGYLKLKEEIEEGQKAAPTTATPVPIPDRVDVDQEEIEATFDMLLEPDDEEEEDD